MNVSVLFLSIACTIYAEEKTAPPSESPLLDRKVDFNHQSITFEELCTKLNGNWGDGPKGVTFSNFNMTETADLSWQTIKTEVTLENCKFNGGVSLNRGQAARGLTFENCEFSSLDLQGFQGKDSLSLLKCKISQFFSCKSLNLEGMLKMEHCTITTDKDVSFQNSTTSEMTIMETNFHGLASMLSFQGAKVLGTFNMNGVDCQMPVIMTDFCIGGDANLGQKNLTADTLVRNSSKRGLIAKRLNISGDFVLSGWDVGDRSDDQSFLDLRGSEIKGTAYLTYLKIPNRALLEGLKVGNDLKLTSNTFGTDPKDIVKATGETKEDRELTLRGQYLTISGSTFMTNCVVYGVTTFSMSEFRGRLELDNCQFIRSGHPLILSGCALNGGLHLSRSALNKNHHFEECVKLNNSKVETFSFFSEALKKGHRFSIIGLTCGSVQDLSVTKPQSRESDVKSRKKLLELSERDDSNSKDLETLLRKRGEIADADSVYIEMRVQQRKSMPFLESIVDATWGCLAGYGRKPLWVVAGCLVIIGIGFVIFGISHLERSNSEDPPLKWIGPPCAFWYSIILFLPFENTQMVEAYLPTNRWVRHYRSLHVVLGWSAMTLMLVIIASRLVN